VGSEEEKRMVEHGKGDPIKKGNSSSRKAWGKLRGGGEISILKGRGDFGVSGESFSLADLSRKLQAKKGGGGKITGGQKYQVRAIWGEHKWRFQEKIKGMSD